jgi:formylglycine-generating enzyme required for sulfatase activity
MIEVPQHMMAELGPQEARLRDSVIKNLWQFLDPKITEKPDSRVGAVPKPSKGTKGPKLLEPAGRVRAGTALGYLIAPSLRVTIAPEWCNVPAGRYPIGEDQHTQIVHLPAFRITRYPVTNALYRHFIIAGGYTTQRWWTEQGWRESQHKSWTKPYYWDDTRFNGDLQPVVGVSWYEAAAFCMWLSDHLEASITLPTDAQWESAARGPDGLIYPWGNDWNDDRANVAGLFAGTTPVMCFANGASWCSVHDLLGNVSEWTRSDYRNYDQTNEIDITNSIYVSHRGGAWNENRALVRCSYRSWCNPGDRDNYLGLRLVME